MFWAGFRSALVSMTCSTSRPASGRIQKRIVRDDQGSPSVRPLKSGSFSRKRATG
jgi:hypothetical protein